MTTGRSAEERLSLLRTTPVCNLSDAMTRLNLRFVRTRGIVPLVSLAPKSPNIVGPAVTVRFVPCHYKTQYRAVANHLTEIVEAAPAGSIVVMEGAAGTTGALGGEMNALTAMRSGHAGQVSDGPVRDVDGLRELGFPVFHKPTPIAASMETYVGTGLVAGHDEYLNCAGALVRPGDYIVGGNDGVIVVPPERVDEIIDAALDMHELETQLRESVRAGKKWSEIYKTTHKAKYGVDD